MSATQKWLYIDVGNRQLVRSGVNMTPIGIPVFNAGSEVVLCCNLLRPNGAAYPLAAGDEFVCGIDLVKQDKTDTSDLMAYADDTAVDIAGDWSAINRSYGMISIRLSCDDDNFWDRIPTDEGKITAYLHIRMTPSGESNSTTILFAKIVASTSVLSKFQ